MVTQTMDELVGKVVPRLLPASQSATSSTADDAVASR